jgi:hypothetical protein
MTIPTAEKRNHNFSLVMPGAPSLAIMHSPSYERPIAGCKHRRPDNRCRAADRGGFGPARSHERCRQLRRPYSALRRAARHLGFNIARHGAKVSCQFFEEFALLHIGRELSDQLAILGFDQQLFQFYPQQIIFHTRGLPHGTAAEGPKVNTSLKFKVGTTQARGFGPAPKKMTVAVLGDATVQVWEEARNTRPSNRNACSGPASGPWKLFSTASGGVPKAFDY